MSPLQTRLDQLPGVGGERSAQLQRLELHTVGDLLLHRPRRYEDRRHFQSIGALKLDHPALVCGKVAATGLRRLRGGRSVFELILDDGSGRLHCRWWNLPFMEKYFKTGDEAVIFGKPSSLRPRTMDHPETEVIQRIETSVHLNRIAPIYPLTEGLPQRWLRSLMWRVLEEFEPAMTEPRPELRVAGRRITVNGTIVPAPTRAQAARMLHFPEEPADADIARHRLALDEFIELQTAIRTRRRNLEKKARALPCAGDNRLIKPFLDSLGFDLTQAQAKVLRAIRHDMAGPAPMRRLLQGDVGSGKTIVAACAALMALESGASAALMAPTEILAEQHGQNFRRWFGAFGIAVEVRAGGRERVSLAPLGPGTPRFYIGTHALLEEGFAPEKLGFVIIDEQHKFGVAQRERFVRKGAYPHLLVMTATPIPRTLGLTLYGDLDISVIDQIPPGRGRIKTFVREPASLPKVWRFAAGELAKGRQAYVVYSRLEEEDTAAGIKAVSKEFHALEKALAPARAALLHGRLPAPEKERVMADFAANRVQALLATSIVEVGLDVPNATVMVVENAEQFGLAQLHQLRGRVGRGADDSWCILISAGKTEEARQRLKIMEETSDGFLIAEADLQFRGPGELLGRQQSGAPPLRFGDLARDAAVVEHARDIVRQGEQAV
ncbi:MAG TPA: ATP-dependent DNA helicase RecG [Verrucomicrobiae bacterium]|jgi:ATP-dependent DNA helicase RecG